MRQQHLKSQVGIFLSFKAAETGHPKKVCMDAPYVENPCDKARRALSKHVSHIGARTFVPSAKR